MSSTFAPASSSFFLKSSASALRDAFLEVLGRALDEVLRLLEAEAGDLADDLDDVDLVRAGFLEDDGELGLLLGGGGGRSRGSRRGDPRRQPEQP